MSTPPVNVGRDRFVERDRFFIPAVRVLNLLAQSPHAACKLVHPAGLSREEVDRALRWLKRRKLVEHDGAWCLTVLGRIALPANGPYRPRQSLSEQRSEQ